ncbi:HD domain-containing phosphohydrolase [Deinobacterium chartae]|nr:HD domain-containing phosphohydrolase [Deinobacterium chartae]
MNPFSFFDGEAPEAGVSGVILPFAVGEYFSEAIEIRDVQGRYLFVNEAAVRLLRRPAEQVIGQLREDLEGLEDPDSELADQQLLRDRRPYTYTRHLTVDGVSRALTTTLLPASPVDAGTLVILSVTHVERPESAHTLAPIFNLELEQRVAERTRDLLRLALTDPLTGLGNRRAFDEDLERLLARPEVGALHLLVVDLDDFKALNDLVGHQHGDQLLHSFARALRAAFQGEGRLYRLGGDEFVGLIYNGPDEGRSQRALLELQRHCRERVEQAAQQVYLEGLSHLSASVGIASYPLEARGGAELMRLADQRMLRQKAGRHAASRLERMHGEQDNRRDDPAESGVVWRAVRSTLALLARDLEGEDNGWEALLAAAVAAVPDADGGTLYMRDGDAFVIQAQVGFTDALLGLRESEEEVRAWYGETELWRVGRARVIRGGQVAQHARRAAIVREGSPEAYDARETLDILRASLCVPVLIDGEVVAQLNLDNLWSDAAFGPQAIMVAEEFAVQVAALLAARIRRTREAARTRELESLVTVSEALYHAQSLEEAELILIGQVNALLNTPDAVYMRYVPELDALHPVSPSGIYRDFTDDLLPRGSGLSWVALEERRTLRVDDVQQDRRVFQPVPMAGRSVIAAPLLDSQGQPIAALIASRPQRGAFSALDARLFSAIASAGATAIERLRATQALRVRAEEFRMLAELSSLVSGLVEPQEVARRCLETCRTFLEADAAVYSDAQLRVFEFAPGVSEDLKAAVYRAVIQRTEGRAAARRVMTSDYTVWPQANRELIAAGTRGLLFLPLPRADGTLSFAGFLWTSSYAVECSVASALAVRSAELIAQAQERQAHLHDLEATREGALLALGLALELRDFETAGHTERVVERSVELGRAMGMSDDELEGVRQGAYLHDVGKLAVPDAILLKPGPLDSDEWRVMQTHTLVGGALMERVSTLMPSTGQMIRWHHERWDGSGYPDRLAGEDIPLCARIFSVVDVYDALTSARPYKRAWSHQEALNEIVAQAGRQFDPRVVEAFVALMAGQEQGGGAEG